MCYGIKSTSADTCDGLVMQASQAATRVFDQQRMVGIPAQPLDRLLRGSNTRPGHVWQSISDINCWPVQGCCGGAAVR